MPKTTESKIKRGVFLSFLSVVGAWVGWGTLTEFAKSCYGDVRNAPSQARGLYSSFKESRSQGGDYFTEPGLFSVVLQRWGITPDDVPRVVSRLWIEVAAWGLVLAFVAGASLWGAPLLRGSVLSSVLVLVGVFSAVCLVLVKISVALWRLAVLKEQKYVPFLDWVCGSKKGSRLGAVVLGLLVLSAPVAGVAAGLSVVPQVDLPSEDLTVKLLNLIFGEGWSKLGGGDSAPGGGPTLIFQLLQFLNAACMISVAWIALLHTLVAAVDAAQTGEVKKAASSWIPLRLAFSFSAITPLPFLNALQILILAGVGVSIDLANSMWGKGLDYIAEGRQIVEYKHPDMQMPKLLPVANEIFRKCVYLHYMTKRGGDSISIKGGENSTQYLFLFVPPRKVHDLYTDISSAHMGMLTLTKTGDASLDAARLSAMRAFVKNVDDIARSAVENERIDDEYATAIIKVANAFSANLTNALRQTAAKLTAEEQKARKEFVQAARTGGWGYAGGIYWSIANIGYANMDKMSLELNCSPMEQDRINSTVYPDWGYYEKALASVGPKVNSAALDIKGTLENAAQTDVSAGSTWKAVIDKIAFLRKLPMVLADSSGKPDMLLSLAKSARYVMDGSEIALVAAVGLEAVAKAGTKLATGNLFSRFGNLLTGGGDAADVLVSTVVTRAVDGVILTLNALFAVAWVFAYVVPSMPYLIWTAALIGWLVLCVEAVIAAPLWLVGHALPEGEGFAGQGGRAGYLLFLSILLRPALLVLCLFVCLLLTSAGGQVISSTFSLFAKSLPGDGVVPSFGVTSCVSLFVILGAVVSICTWKLFSLITALPDRILRWVGQTIHNLGSEDVAPLKSGGAPKLAAIGAGFAAGAASGGGGGGSPSGGGGKPKGGGAPLVDEHSQLDVAAKAPTVFADSSSLSGPSWNPSTTVNDAAWNQEASARGWTHLKG